jgi:hypothetical protein
MKRGMTRQWTEVSREEAEQHPLFGLGGWFSLRRVRVTFEHKVLLQHERVDSVPATTPLQPVAPWPAGPSAVPPLHKQSLDRHQVETAALASAASDRLCEADREEFWAVALVEYEGADRRPGVYARAYAEACGDEPLVKSLYLKRRYQELEAAALAQQSKLRANA